MTTLSGIGIDKQPQGVLSGTARQVTWKADKTVASREEESIRTDQPDVAQTAPLWSVFITAYEGNTFHNIKVLPRTPVADEQTWIVSTGRDLDRYSQEYISYQTRAFVKQITRELGEWEKAGPKEGIANIATLKELVEEYLPYLTQRTENRIFITVIELLLENHTWQNITVEQLQALQKILERYQEKNIEWKGLEILHKELYRLQLDILITNGSESEEEEEETGNAEETAH